MASSFKGSATLRAAIVRATGVDEDDWSDRWDLTLATRFASRLFPLYDGATTKTIKFFDRRPGIKDAANAFACWTRLRASVESSGRAWNADEYRVEYHPNVENLLLRHVPSDTTYPATSAGAVQAASAAAAAVDAPADVMDVDVDPARVAAMTGRLRAAAKGKTYVNEFVNDPRVLAALSEAFGLPLRGGRRAVGGAPLRPTIGVPRARPHPVGDGRRVRPRVASPPSTYDDRYKAPLRAALRRAFEEPLPVFVDDLPLAAQVPFDLGTLDEFLARTAALPPRLYNGECQAFKTGVIALEIPAAAVLDRIVLVLMGINSKDAVGQLQDKVTSDAPVEEDDDAAYRGFLHQLGLTRADIHVDRWSDGQAQGILDAITHGIPTAVFALVNESQLKALKKFFETHGLLERVHVIIDEVHGIFPLSEMSSENVSKKCAGVLRDMLWRLEENGEVMRRRVAGISMVSATPFDMQAARSIVGPIDTIEADKDRMASLGYFGISDLRSFTGGFDFDLERLSLANSFGRDRGDRFRETITETKTNSDGRQKTTTMRVPTSDEAFLRDATLDDAMPALRAFFDHAFGDDQTEPTFLLEATTQRKDAARCCTTMCRWALKFWPRVHAFAVCGDAYYRYFRIEDGVEVEVFDETGGRFKSLKDAFAAARAFDASQPFYVCTNAAGGSVTFIGRDADRAITHVIPGTLRAGETDVNVVLQTLGRACHYNRGLQPGAPRDPATGRPAVGPRLLHDGESSYALMLGSAENLRELRSYWILTSFGAANMANGGTIGGRGAVYPLSTAGTDVRGLATSFRIGHVKSRAHVTVPLTQATYLPADEACRTLGPHAEENLRRRLAWEDAVDVEGSDTENDTDVDVPPPPPVIPAGVGRREINHRLVIEGDDRDREDYWNIDFVLERQVRIPVLFGRVPVLRRAVTIPLSVDGTTSIKEAVLVHQAQLLTDHAGSGAGSSSRPPPSVTASDLRHWHVVKWTPSSSQSSSTTTIPYVERSSGEVVVLLRVQRPGGSADAAVPRIDMRFRGDAGEEAGIVVEEVFEAGGTASLDLRILRWMAARPEMKATTAQIQAEFPEVVRQRRRVLTTLREDGLIEYANQAIYLHVLTASGRAIIAA